MARPMNRHNRRGSALVEAAITLPLFAMTVFGGLEFGSLFFMRHSMVHAAREAVRSLAMEGGSVQEAEQVARDMLPSSDDLDFEISTIPPTSYNSAARVEIALPASQAAIGDFFGILDGRTISVSSAMRSER